MVKITPKIRKYFIDLLGTDEAEKLIHAAKYDSPILISGPRLTTGKTTLTNVLRAMGCTHVYENWQVRTIQVQEPLKHRRERTDIFESLDLPGESKKKPDIVEYVEKVWAWNLLDYQKEFIRKTYDYLINNKQLCCIPPRDSSKFNLELLRAIVVIILGKERGLIK